MKHKPSKRAVRETIRKLEEADMTDAQIASGVEVSEGTIRNWRNGTLPHPRSFRALVALAERVVR